MDMLAGWFEPQHRKDADEAELDRLRDKYGVALHDELRDRVTAAENQRSRKHWQRLLRKARWGL
jgi:hypothetical protein